MVNFTNSELEIAELVNNIRIPTNIDNSNDTIQNNDDNETINDEGSMPYQPLNIPKTNIVNMKNLPSYHKPMTSVKLFITFHFTEFPISHRLYHKWKNGIRLWTKKKFACSVQVQRYCY